MTARLVRHFAVMTVAIRRGRLARATLSGRSVASAERLSVETTALQPHAAATQVLSPLARGARVHRVGRATKARRGTRGRSKAAVAPLHRDPAGEAHLRDPVEGRLPGPGHHVGTALAKNGEATVEGRVVLEDRLHGPGVHVAKEMAVSGRLAGRRIVVAVQGGRLEVEAGPALRRATRRDGLVAGRDL